MPRPTTTPSMSCARPARKSPCLARHVACGILSVLLAGALETALGEDPPGRTETATKTAAEYEKPTYLAKPDASYAWKEVGEPLQQAGTTLITLRMVSQTWQGIEWKHWLRLFEPEKLDHAKDCLLIVSGGRHRDEPGDAKSKEAQFLMQLAKDTGSVVALIEQVPFQPMFDDLYEDEIIAHTFVRFLETRDESWPLLLPMVKSAQRAMDTVSAWTKKHRGEGRQAVERFVITGASKRGWTSWLTAAHDERVIGTAPMVIDTLNFRRQMPHQIHAWGEYSEEIGDYTELGLTDEIQEPKSKRLLELVDPWTYRERLTVPKLLLIGTNDRYWPVDAIKHYLGDLRGETRIHYVPNAGHGLGNGLSATQAIGGFYRHLIEEEPLPSFSWKTQAGEDATRLIIRAETAPERVRLWTAARPDRDFRPARFKSELLSADGMTYEARIPHPESGYVAAYADLLFADPAGRRFTLSTQVDVFGPEGVDFPSDDALRNDTLRNDAPRDDKQGEEDSAARPDSGER